MVGCAPRPKGEHETPRIHHPARRRSDGAAARRSRAAGRADAARRRAHQRGRERSTRPNPQCGVSTGAAEIGLDRWSQRADRHSLYRRQSRRHSQFCGGIGSTRAGRHPGHWHRALAPLLQATRSVPIVFANVADPVGAGFVDSLSRPGGNATGFMQFEYGLSGKWLALLKEIAPGVTRAAVLRDPAITAGIGQFAIIQSVAPSIGIEVSPVSVRDTAEIERAVTAFARSSNAGLIVTASALSSVHRDLIITLAARHKLPAVYYRRGFVSEVA